MARAGIEPATPRFSGAASAARLRESRVDKATADRSEPLKTATSGQSVSRDCPAGVRPHWRSYPGAAFATTRHTRAELSRRLTRRVHHPDVRLLVEPFVAFPVDLDRHERARHDVAARLGERHLGPFLPISDRARDPHRFRGDLYDLGSETLVGPQPGVEVCAIRAAPADVALHRSQRIAVLQVRPDRSDERVEPVVATDLGHPLDHATAEALGAALACDHDLQRAEHGRGRSSLRELASTPAWPPP